jgi:hypothetical protein
VTPLNVRLARERALAADDSFQRKLNEHIAMEQWEKRLTPLFLFKGTDPYRIRALWNIAYGMYLRECDSYGYGARTIGVGDTGHLCGVHSMPQGLSMRSIFGRLRGCRGLTDSVSKAFTEYVEWLHPAPCVFERVPLEVKRGAVAWWRVPAPKATKVWRPPTEKVEEHVYPFVNRQPTSEHQLLLDIHAKIPKGFPHDIRGDLCQDLVVAVLSGETTVDNIPDVIAKYARNARKFLPDRWKNVSIDEPIPGTDGLRLEDILSDESEEYCEHEDDGCGCH